MMNRREFLAASAGAALLVGRLADPRRILAAAAYGVCGRVWGGRALADVLVSDGRRVVRTGKHGRYELPIGVDSGRFVFVTTPRGYWTDSFSVPLPAAAARGQVDFSLRAVEQPDDFDLVFTPTSTWITASSAIPKFRASRARFRTGRGSRRSSCLGRLCCRAACVGSTRTAWPT